MPRSSWTKTVQLLVKLNLQQSFFENSEDENEANQANNNAKVGTTEYGAQK